MDAYSVNTVCEVMGVHFVEFYNPEKNQCFFFYYLLS